MPLFRKLDALLRSDYNNSKTPFMSNPIGLQTFLKGVLDVCARSQVVISGIGELCGSIHTFWDK